MTTESAAMYSSALLSATPPTASVIDHPPTSIPTPTPPVSAADVAPASSNPVHTTDSKVHPASTTTSLSAAHVAAAAAAAAAAPSPQIPPPMAAAAAAAAFGQYPPGMVFASPDPAVIEDQPTYVNPKQYARILKRRESRKKQTGTDVTSYTPRKRSYMHESRHKHAMQRRRGPGGRFLSKEEREDVARNSKESVAAGQ